MLMCYVITIEIGSSGCGARFVGYTEIVVRELGKFTVVRLICRLSCVLNCEGMIPVHAAPKT